MFCLALWSHDQQAINSLSHTGATPQSKLFPLIFFDTVLPESLDDAHYDRIARKLVSSGIWSVRKCCQSRAET